MQFSRASIAKTASLILLAWLVPGGVALAAQVTLAWDVSPDTNVVGYALYFGTVTGDYTERMDVQNGLAATVTNLVAGTEYYFVVTAYTADLLESLPSNEVSFLVPGAFQMAQTSTRGMAVLGFSGQTSEVIAVQASEDLKVWTTLYELHPATNLPIQIVDPDSARLPQRFYRLSGTNVALRKIQLAQLPASTAAKLAFVLPPGSRCRIEASADLANWTTLLQLGVVTNRWLEFVDLASASMPQRFYRLVSAD